MKFFNFFLTGSRGAEGRQVGTGERQREREREREREKRRER